uniref:Xylulose kinase-1 n=1 Tax=Tanacetum cinerariifolium TaxID=118510 RepID=A0A699I8B7_TANCI|nr:hypothetical protein [Tanacetum cinerariifolium]
MLTPTFAETHNLVAFLEKPAESAGFEQIIGFLKSKPIHYALIVIPTIYVSYVKQFWATAKVNKDNDQEQIQALVDKTKVIITKDSIRSDLRLDDAEGTACLLNEAIFEGLARHKELYNISSHTKKILANIRRIGTSFSRAITHLFDTMMVQAPADMGDIPVETHQTPIGSMIEEIDQNTKIALDDKTQGRTNDDEMFGVDDLAGEEVVVETTIGIKDSTAPTTDVTEDEITMAQTLAASKSVNPKVVDKGKTKMIEPEVPLKKKEHIRIDEEYARKLQAEEQELARLSRAQQDKEANNSWDNIQAMMDADRLLAERLLAREREEFSEVQKARLLVELIEKRKKHFAALRAQEKRRKPPTKTQMKSQMSIEMKSHISETYGEMRKVNDFVAMDSKAQKSSAKEAQESSTKRTIDYLKSDISKKQKVDKNVKPVGDDSEELRKCIEIVPNDGDKGIIYYLLVEKVYPLTRNTLHLLWSDVRLQVDYDVEMAYDLLRFIRKQLMEGYTP